MQNNTPTNITDAEHKDVIKRLERFSRFMDSSIRLPFTSFKLGAESLVGMLPVVGDFAGLLLSLYVLLMAQNIGAPGEIKFRILRNIFIDFLGGLLPVVGDLFDMIFKATNIFSTHKLGTEWIGMGEIEQEGKKVQTQIRGSGRHR